MQKEIEEPVLEEASEVDDATENAEILEDAQKDADNEKPIAESVEQSARKALEELQTGDNAGDKEQTQDKEVAPEAPVKKGPGRPKKEVIPSSELADPDLVPPVRFNLKAKEAFNKASPEIKKEIARAVRDLEGVMTRSTQENSKATNEAKHVLEAVRPYLLANPELAERGITESVFVSGLVAAHQKLVDPKRKEQAFIELAHSTGNQHLLAKDAATSTNSGPDISNHPIVKQLQEQNSRLQQMVEPAFNERRQAQASQEAAYVDSITAELEAVQNQTDSSGRYINPELHNAEFVKRWNPLVFALVGSAGKTPTEAAQIALQQLRGPDSTKPIQAKLPANNRSVTAATSVRGRIAPVTSSLRSDDDIPSNETPAQSAQRALDDLRRGLN